MPREETLEQLRERIWRLPADERIALLLCSCTQLMDESALGTPLGILGVLGVMGERLAPYQRAVLAERMRVQASRLERFPRQQIEVVVPFRKVVPVV